MRRFILAVALALGIVPSRATPVADLLPALGPYNAVALPFTPEGLPTATEAGAADYLRPDGRHLGALLATAPGAAYDPITTLAWFAEGEAGITAPVLLDGHAFDRITVTRTDGSVVYAVGFLAYREHGVFVVDGRRGATLPASVEAFHVVAWASNEDAAAGLAAASLAQLAAAEPVAFLRDDAPPMTALAAPDAYPNPFAETTTFRFGLSAPGTVDLAVYDLLGRRVARLATTLFDAGTHTLPFDARSLAAGVYVVRLTVGGQTATRRLTKR